MSNGDTTSPENGTLLQQLGQHIFMVNLHVGWPKLQHQITNAVVEVKTGSGDDDKEEISEDRCTKPSWKLMPDLWHNRFVNIEGRTRRALSEPSRPFGKRGGIQLLPISRAEAAFYQLRELRDEFHLARDEFVRAYSGILREAESGMTAEAWTLASERVPSPGAVVDKFDITWAILPITGSGVDPQLIRDCLDDVTELRGYASNTVPADRWDRLADRLVDMLPRTRGLSGGIPTEEGEALIREARSQMTSMAQQLVEDIARGPRHELAEAVANMLDIIGRGGNVQSGTLAKIERAISQIRGFAFLADDALLDRISQLESNMGHAVQDINTSTEISAQLSAGLRQVLEQATDEVAVSQSMRAFRNVRVTRPRPSPIAPTPEAVGV